MQVFLIRHGQTFENVLRVHQGWTEASLDEVGEAQARALRDVISGIRFDRIIASDLRRTRQTAAILFGEDAQIEYDERLREINNTVFKGKTKAELYPIYGDTYIENCQRLNFAEYGGESSQSLLDRTADFMRELAEDTTSERVAVVTHGGTIRATIAGVLGMPLFSPRLEIDNCSVTRLAYTDLGWRLIHLNNKTEI